MRFLLSRRWVLFALVVALLAWGASLLGQWQFHRLDERQAQNRIVATNLDAPPVPVDDLLSPTRTPSPEDEWRRVTVHGSWDAERSVVLKYQTRDSQPGIDVVTPLVTDSGSAVLVDRGWLATDNSGASRPDLPAVAEGRVTVTGWVRRDATGASTRVDELSTRAVSSRALEEELPYPLYRGFLDLAAQSPAPPTALAPADLPDDTSDGPHFFYGLQWWFFGALAIFGFGYLAFDELRQRRRGRAPGQPGQPARAPARAPDQPASERAEHATVDGQHRPGHEG